MKFEERYQQSKPTFASHTSPVEISIDMEQPPLPDPSNKTDLLTSGEKIRFSTVLTVTGNRQGKRCDEHHQINFTDIEFEKAKFQLFISLCKVLTF